LTHLYIFLTQHHCTCFDRSSTVCCVEWAGSETRIVSRSLAVSPFKCALGSWRIACDNPHSEFTTESEDREQATAKEILAYFVGNPGAADTFEGIARWRLLEWMMQRDLSDTEAALAWLLERGYLRKREFVGLKPVFSLNLERIAEAESLIGETQRREQ
jgi:hypothetical protein